MRKSASIPRSAKKEPPALISVDIGSDRKQAPSGAEEKTQINTKLPVSEFEKLKQVAKEDGMTVTGWIRHTIRRRWAALDWTRDDER